MTNHLIIFGIAISFMTLMGLAFFFRSWLLKMFVIAIVVMIMILNEHTIGAKMRALVEMERKAGTSADEYYRGALAVIHYRRDTEAIPVITSVFLMILCASGFRQRKRRRRKQEIA